MIAARMNKRLEQHFLNQSGQMVTELFAVIPAFLVTLVVVSNLFAFIALTAKMDKMACEIARQIYQMPFDPYGSKEALIQGALQKKSSRHLYVTLSYINSPDSEIEGRHEVRVCVYWQPFGSSQFVQRLPILSRPLVRTKKIYVSTGEVVSRP